MNKRTISVTLEQAQEWYKSGNETLKNLALTAYTKEELQPSSYEAIMQELYDKTACACFTYHLKDRKAVEAIIKLRNIAAFFNGEWKKEPNVNGYFISPKHLPSSYIAELKYGWAVLSHTTVSYPGIVYFRNKEDAVKALDMAYRESWLNDLK